MNAAERRTAALQWFRHATEDLSASETLLSQEFCAPRHVCWLAQQAAEKSLKAILVFLQIDFPKTHDLDALRNLIPWGWRVKTEYDDLAELSEWAVQARYPGDWAEASESDAGAALEQARALVAMVRDELADRGVSFQPEQ
ncbi:MAG: HEPN domain-containing protein [Phycisphaerae bacterium]